MMGNTMMFPMSFGYDEQIQGRPGAEICQASRVTLEAEIVV